MNSLTDSEPEAQILAAKAQTQAFERHVAELVPESSVSAIDQIPYGSLQACSAGDMWAGGLTIQLRTGVGPATALRHLGSAAVADGFEVDEGNTFDGALRITITGDADESIVLDASAGSISGGSFSRCFKLPHDFYRGGEY